MQFPEKHNFFDLNELECRLIAPRLAFQKKFQAPRGGQLKIIIARLPPAILIIKLPQILQRISGGKMKLRYQLG